MRTYNSTFTMSSEQEIPFSISFIYMMTKKTLKRNKQTYIDIYFKEILKKLEIKADILLGN